MTSEHRVGFSVLIILTWFRFCLYLLFFFGGFWAALVGAGVWGLGMGIHELIIPAGVAPMVSARHRASAFGTFTAAYGIFWFIGSAAIGILYDHSPQAVVAFCVIAQLAAVPVFIWVKRQPLRGTHRGKVH